MTSSPDTKGISWNNGVPVADAFDDPYYSLDDGLAESRFVFLDGADVLIRARGRSHFTIGETGFGTGLNFLATWQAWRKEKIKSRLVFVSAEAFPLDRGDLKKAHDNFPELAELAEQLRGVWPPAAGGFHPRDFDDGNISLLLLFGPAEEAFSELDAVVDAWFLDGFAPAKNPEMWTENLFEQLSRLSAPSATLATFTAAGFVRRGLQEQGFAIKKVPGFGRKRERLVGHHNNIHQPPNPARSRDVAWTTPARPSNGKIVIVGGGIGGASTAYALRKRGRTPVLINSDKCAAASDVPAAILAPRFLLDDQPERAFFNSAYAYAMCHPAIKHARAHHSGIEIVAPDDATASRYRKIFSDYGWDKNWMSLKNSNLYLPQIGTINTQKALSALTAGLETINASVDHLIASQNGWRLIDQNGDLICHAETVILAAGIETTRILNRSNLAGSLNEKTHPPVQANGGQVEVIDEQLWGGFRHETISFGGYLTATLCNEKRKQYRTLGSTFINLDEDAVQDFTYTAAAKKKILEQGLQKAGIKVENSSETVSWAGVRATVADHLPFAGPVPDWNELADVCAPLALDANAPPGRPANIHEGLFCLTGLGSKGFQYAPLLGEYIAALITGEPVPLSRELVKKLHPGRSFVKAIIRGAQTKQLL